MRTGGPSAGRLTLTARLTLAALLAGTAAGDRAARAGAHAEVGPRPVAGSHPVGDGAKHLTLFYTGEIHGTLEPCGCTSDPLGDVARYAALVRGAAKSAPVLLVDGGGLSFPESSGVKERPANNLRARFLGRTLGDLGPFAAGLAEADLSGGAREVVPSRLAVNLSGSPVVAPSVLKATARLDADLESWSQGGGDPAFIAAKRRERQRLADERKGLDAPWAPPAAGNYFTNQLIPLRRSLPRDAKVAAEMRHLDGQVAAINLRNAAPPAPREPGRAYFVGDAKCAGCHQAALAFWKTTVHATAWHTLVEVDKENDYRCIGCHVTGYAQVGGTSLGHTDHLRDVQCEVCHGPASIHVEQKGLEEPSSLHRETPASTCTGCHTTQHSDTFQYEAYLRDILGPGHGANARKKLGDGPTGHTLRSAALNRAKTAGVAEAQKNL